MIMLTRLALSLVLCCHVSVLALSAALVDKPSMDPVNDKIINEEAVGSKFEYDLSLYYLKEKVWDVILVTDDYGMEDDMANEEDALFMKALERLGRKVHRASIEDEEFDWRAGKSIVIRSAWAKVRLKEAERMKNYEESFLRRTLTHLLQYRYLDYYIEFLDTVDTHSFLFNQVQLIRWQTNKIQYMRQLANFVKVPYTLIIPHEESEYPEYSELVEIMNCTDIIIKPAQGNSGLGVRLINQENLDLYKIKMEQYLWEKEDDMLIQCFMYSVAHDGPGEINVYLIDGKVTHAGYSVPAEGHYLIHEEHGGDGDDHVPSKAEIEFATKVYNAASGIVGVKPLYFRVDMMYDNDGELTLMEIACGTTDMNFRDEPESADIMAQALDRFLLEKETAYEQVHGQRPPLIELHAFEKRVDETYDSFGTPLRNGTYGKEKPWKHTLKRTTTTETDQEEL